jgi:hypothetical protein
VPAGAERTGARRPEQEQGRTQMSKMAMSRALVLLAAAGALALPVSDAGAAEYQHPRLYRNETQTVSGERVPLLAWGTLDINSEALKAIKCVNLIYGDLWNATEAGAETEHAYGEVLEWTGTGFLNKESKEAGDRCQTAEGFEAWGAVEPPLYVTLRLADVKEGEGATEEREVINQVRREPPSVPWRQEAIGELTPRGQEVMHLKTGIASSTCYPGDEITERQKNATERETESRLRAAPPGCVRINIVIPQFGFEEEFQGSFRLKVINGAHNGLSASRMQVEGTEERLESVFGPATVSTEVPLHLLGFATEELLTVGAR